MAFVHTMTCGATNVDFIAMERHPLVEVARTTTTMDNGLMKFFLSGIQLVCNWCVNQVGGLIGMQEAAVSLLLNLLGHMSSSKVLLRTYLWLIVAGRTTR